MNEEEREAYKKVAEILDRELTALTFDVASGSWVFSETLDIHKIRIENEEFQRCVVMGRKIGAVIYLILNAPIPLPQVIADRTVETAITAVATGAIVGAVVGNYLGKNAAAKAFHFRVKKVELRIERERKALDKRAQKILLELFRSAARTSHSITCVKTGELLFIPVEAPILGSPVLRGGLLCSKVHRCGIFEYSVIKKEIEKTGKCPRCKNRARLADFKVKPEKREEISRIIGLTTRYLMNRKAETHTVDILSAEFFLQNHKEIIRKIRDESLEDLELDFLSRLVRERIDNYNLQVETTGVFITIELYKRREELGEEQYLDLHKKLIKWINAFKIPSELGIIENPALQNPSPNRSNPAEIETDVNPKSSVPLPDSPDEKEEL